MPSVRRGCGFPHGCVGTAPSLGVSVRIWTWGVLVRGNAHPQITMAMDSHNSGLIYTPPLFMPNSVLGTCET